MVKREREGKRETERKKEKERKKVRKKEIRKLNYYHTKGLSQTKECVGEKKEIKRIAKR